ncbi:hypothetical protein AUJ46_03225 [Candidatus Peregrinibacteria bacterium CG1_02_54_53]|nr:MAG: hypothetical protein AUJ46_03225 [Candidatus Peregrinibacteria bacterium CG1_02_54_53]
MPTLPQELFERDASIKEIAQEMLRNGAQSPERIMLSCLLAYRQQKQLVDQTRNLVIATWVLATVTVAIALTTTLLK